MSSLPTLVSTFPSTGTMQPRSNRFLSMVMRELRRGRPQGTETDCGMFIEQTMYGGRPYMLPLSWFVTQGCSNDRGGGCTMCNFGVGNIPDQEAILRQVRRIMDNVAGLPLIYVTPIGSMFDDGEVPPRVREEIFTLVRKSGCSIFGTESRADTITDDKIGQFRDICGEGIELQVGIGLDTADDYVSRNCINKRSTCAEHQRAISVFHRHGVKALIHVLMKPPFLTEAEAVEDAVSSINWAFANRADRVVFLMTNLKAHTLASWMAERGHYRVPFVRSGALALKRARAGVYRPATLSGIYSGIPVQKLAYNCDKCSSRSIERLQQFSMSLDPSWLEDVLSEDCACSDEWNRAMSERQEPLSERLGREYEYIARNIYGDEWWHENRDWVLQEVTDSARKEQSPPSLTTQENRV